MIPKRDATFFRLPSDLRALYLTGMPRAYLDAPNFIPQFKNEKTSKGVLKNNVQQEAFEFFKTNELGTQEVVIFCSSPSDHQALACVSNLLREKHKAGFNKFEFVHPTEIPPMETVKDLYVLTGVHETDHNIVANVRRWCRTSLGAEIWIVLTAKDPCKWFTETLGIKPQFLFSLKDVAISVG